MKQVTEIVVPLSVPHSPEALAENLTYSLESFGWLIRVAGCGAAELGDKCDGTDHNAALEEYVRYLGAIARTLHGVLFDDVKGGH
jgi:hypothetical protein